MPSALGSHEWAIIIGWVILGFIFYYSSMNKFGTENSDAHLNREIDGVLNQNKK